MDADQHSPHQRPEMTDDALAALMEGNARVVAERAIHPRQSGEHRASLAMGQHPAAVVLTCSDSRVTPVHIFDQGIGDLFVVRVAGNVVDEHVAASIEFAVDQFGTKLLIVMGHDNCGAVTAAYHAYVDRDADAHAPNEIQSLLARIEPALRNIDSAKSEQEQIDQAIENNVRESIRQFLRVPDLQHAQQEGRLRIVGANYSLRTGVVRLLDV